MLRRRPLFAAALAALPLPALAQGWPARPIRLVVPFAPGGTTDIVARIVGQAMQERLGQPVIVDNRPGAGATTASQQVADAAPDGYTLIVSNSASHGISPSLFRTVRYDAVTDFSHIALIATTSNAAIVNPAYPARTIGALVALARSRPDGLDFAMSGFGTTTHLLGLRFGIALGVRMNPVAYRGSGPALADLVAGTVGLMFDGLPSSIPFIREGRIRALAVADATRNRFLPEVPTFAEAGMPQIVSSSWFGISGPRGMDPALVARLNAEIRAILATPAVQERWTSLTANIPDTTPEHYAAFIAEELRVWGEVVRATGATAE
ncbi:MAG: tripartite tricarboxylate transporter substrate binding protein [Acetobacteraceae bacterium]|nr:tripartite tricarboxylate transporter substrate binding protein [Acetobacteraceae bacterium]